MNKEIASIESDVVKNPIGYSKIHEVNFCSNLLIDVFAPFGINDKAPILIGNGEVPVIWLYAPDQYNTWLPIVEKNKSKLKTLKVEENKIHRTVRVSFNRITIIEAQMLANGSCVVISLDLRPIGLLIYGNQNELKIGESKFQRNTMIGARFAIGLA